MRVASCMSFRRSPRWGTTSRTGALAPAEAASLAQEVFGGWTSHAGVLPPASAIGAADPQVLVVDMPQGKGDAKLSLVKTITLDVALMVTTPQEVSTSDVRRAIRMFERVNTRILGVVENMAGYECPGCGHHAHIFGEGGGKRLAADMQVPLLGEVPLDIQVREAGDAGSPTTVSAPTSAAGRAFRDVAQRLMAELDAPVGAA